MTLTRVLFINHGSSIGGAETNLLNILRFADLGTYQPVGVLLPDRGALALEIEALGIPVGVVNYRGLSWRNPIHYLSTQRSLVDWIRRTQADVVHLNHQWLIDSVIPAGRRARVPVVCHVRNYLTQDFVAAQFDALNSSAYLIAVSNAVRERVIELGCKDQATIVIHDGIEMERFANLKEYNRSLGHEIATSGKTIGFVGRIVPEKGPEDLLLALSGVVAQAPDVKLVFWGEDEHNGEYLNWLVNHSVTLGVEDKVKFLGFQSNIEQAFRHSDVIVVPSRPEMPEGLPLVIVEALASGCIVVATPNSGITELLVDEQTGFLAEPRNPSSLVEKILRALQLSPEQHAHLVESGRNAVRQSFSISRQVMELGKIYVEATNVDH